MVERPIILMLLISLQVCSSGLSGETLPEHGHHWIGYDISKSMLLDVALERETEGDLLLVLADMIQGCWHLQVKVHLALALLYARIESRRSIRSFELFPAKVSLQEASPPSTSS